MTDIRKKLLTVVFLATLTGLLLSLSGSALAAAPGDTLWARSSAAGTSPYSNFSDVSVDSNGNAYAVGITGIGLYDFGNGVTVAGGRSVIVKYNSSGLAQWAKSAAADFNGVSFDASGNIYAVGIIYGIGLYDFGNGVTVASGNDWGNTVIVKYDSSGLAQWAKSTAAGAPSNSYFYGVSVDASGN